MWSLCALFFIAAKAASLAQVPLSFGARNSGRTAAYLLLWPGMDAAQFLGEGNRAKEPDIKAWLGASARVAAGIALIWGAAPKIEARSPLAAGWIGMTGGVLCLHFGVFDLVSLGWRSFGVNTQPLMNSPHLATSIASFWSERWNRAFHALVLRLVFRPVARRAGPVAGLWAGFAVSGLVHDAVISVPAGAGYGLPTLYFLIQAAGVSLERTTLFRGLYAKRKLLARALAWAWIAAPAPLLFTTPFVRHVILPFLHALQSI